jgi:hypothetical protein
VSDTCTQQESSQKGGGMNEVAIKIIGGTNEVPLAD